MAANNRSPETRSKISENNRNRWKKYREQRAETQAIIKRMASKKQKAGMVQPSLEGYLQRRNQTLNEWVIENQLGSLMHLRKKCEEMGMSPPASVPWDTPWLGYRPKPPPPQPAPAPEPAPVVAKTEEAPAPAPKKKKKQVEEGSSVRTMLHEMQEDAPKDADS